jgi:hypothetical protein
LKTLEGPLISISPWTAKLGVLVDSHLLRLAVKSKAKPQLEVLTERIWEEEPSVSAKLRNAHPAAAAAAVVVETGAAAAVETGVAAAVETDVAAVETDVAAVAVAVVAEAAASRTALETDFSRSPQIAPSPRDSLSNAIWRCKLGACTR